MKEITTSKAIGWLIGLFILVAALVSGLYYLVCNITNTPKTGSDIANIFVASATLLGPLVLVFTFNAWKGQHNINIKKDIALKFYHLLSELYKNAMILQIEVNRLTYEQSILYISLERMENIILLVNKINENKIEMEISKNAILYLEVIKIENLQQFKNYVREMHIEIDRLSNKTNQFYLDLNDKLFMLRSWQNQSMDQGINPLIREAASKNLISMESKPVVELLRNKDGADSKDIDEVNKMVNKHKEKLESLLKDKIILN